MQAQGIRSWWGRCPPGWGRESCLGVLCVSSRSYGDTNVPSLHGGSYTTWAASWHRECWGKTAFTNLWNHPWNPVPTALQSAYRIDANAFRMQKSKWNEQRIINSTCVNLILQLILNYFFLFFWKCHSISSYTVIFQFMIHFKLIISILCGLRV